MLIAQITITTMTPRTTQPVVDIGLLKKNLERNKPSLDGKPAANGNG